MESIKKRVILVVALLVAMTMVAGCGKTEEKVETQGISQAGDTVVATGEADKKKQDPIKFKLSLVDPDSSNFAKGARKIAEEVATATDGQIEIEVFSGGSLGGERDTVELAMSNNLDIATCANSVLTNFIPEMGILDQAYLWKNIDEAHAAVDGKLGDLIKAAAENKGLHIIGFMEAGFRNTFSVKPIVAIEDFQGVTIRTMENPYHQAAFESFGAMPIAMSYNDVFTALQQGTIDAAENATANCLASGYYEVTKHITNTNHAFVYILLCMSDDAWNKIPEDLREPFVDGVQRGVEAQRQYLVEANEEATVELKELGVEFHDIDIQQLQDAYTSKAKEKGFIFQEDWQVAIDEAVESVK